MSAKPPNDGSSSTDPNNTSYTTMPSQVGDTDATLLGTHCELPYCNQLDFLPFYCQSCHHTFCLDHRTETAHKCANPGAWAQRKREANLARPALGADKPMRDFISQKPCSSPTCKTTIGTSLVPGVHCPSCNRDYCLKHRLKEDHECATQIPLGAVPKSAPLETARNALERFKIWSSAQKQKATRSLPKPKPSSAAARVIAVNTLKKTAKGDEKLAPEKRVYLYVEAEAETAKAKFPKGQFFYSKDWVVGRVLDAAAKSLQVQNVNNQSNDERDRLRVFHVEGGRVLEFSEKVGSSLVSGNTIVLLRGVGPAPDLIEV